MLWRIIGRACLASGLLMLLWGLNILPASSATPHIPLEQPSPRPTLPPTDVPATTPEPNQPESKSSNSDSERAPQTGHITGTVIDSTTGAPVPGIQVNIGDMIVTSDENGNYDYWVPEGDYNVELNISPNIGTAIQGAQTVNIKPGSATVLHLQYRSSLRITPVPAGQTTQWSPQVVAQSQSAPINQPIAVKPTRLPETSNLPYGSAWLWLSFGAMFAIAGGWLSLTRASRARVLRAVPGVSEAAAYAYANADITLLTALLTADVYRVKRTLATNSDPANDEPFLHSLLFPRKKQ
ncbi:MAG: hypothetical protein GFH27_549371n41 [Chloroflexi bacterium AL-W]|nr:hypothetical protein [Chloroflexi bacterium AL-N1]NOK70902.1 hypothetical protein [Chloroflexi bacterium AL-N10]NOK78571.1 hypothetical protein [Chloroflexi bacterium AL-N5]NOK85803.1 hypothetical protein [Chloroflexi bacterium AL-W]NOK92719.1 hypothetical protein [Chloroflexi bacterium AL-N15]